MHTFNPSSPEAEEADICEFKTIMVYRANSRTRSKATQRNPVSKNQKPIPFKKNWESLMKQSWRICKIEHTQLYVTTSKFVRHSEAGSRETYICE